jgi:hypothetical protein
MAHAYNPSYSRGRDQEDSHSKPAWANSSAISQKKPITKKGLVEWLKMWALSGTQKKKKKSGWAL